MHGHTRAEGIARSVEDDRYRWCNADTRDVCTMKETEKMTIDPKSYMQRRMCRNAQELAAKFGLTLPQQLDIALAAIGVDAWPGWSAQEWGGVTPHVTPAVTLGDEDSPASGDDDVQPRHGNDDAQPKRGDDDVRDDVKPQPGPRPRRSRGSSNIK